MDHGVEAGDLDASLDGDRSGDMDVAGGPTSDACNGAPQAGTDPGPANGPEAIAELRTEMLGQQTTVSGGSTGPDDDGSYPDGAMQSLIHRDGTPDTGSNNFADLTGDLDDEQLDSWPEQSVSDTGAYLESEDDGENLTVHEHGDQAESAPGEEEEDEYLDVAMTIGRVLSISGSVVYGALLDDPDGMARKVARMGSLVSMHGPDSRIFGIINSMQRDRGNSNGSIERTVFEVRLLGEILTATPEGIEEGFRRGISIFPALESQITTVTTAELRTIYARPRASNVQIGVMRQNRRLPAFVITDSLLGRHFAVVGTTGAGKSCAVTVILRAILRENPSGHIVLLDPHNEYASAFSDRAHLLSPANLQLPYWLLNFEEISHVLVSKGSPERAYAEAAILEAAITRAKAMFAGDDSDLPHITADTPVPYRLSDLATIIRDGMGALNKSENSAPYLHLIGTIERIRADTRYAFMFSGFSVRDNMSQVLADILRIPVDGKPITILDISGVPSEIVDVVVSVLFRLIFEFAVWSERENAPPVLLVCEESHRYIPEDASAGFGPTRRSISRIAKEGRKYGLSLCLVSQRPSELSMNSLSQCNTIFSLRLGNDHDQSFVARCLPENARWLIDALPSLNTQEAVVVGDGVTVPFHVRFDDLDPEHRPSGENASFSERWQSETQDDSFIDAAIDRWRRQAR